MGILVMDGCWPRGVRSPLRLQEVSHEIDGVGDWVAADRASFFGFGGRLDCSGICGFGFFVGPAGQVIGLLNVLL